MVGESPGLVLHHIQDRRDPALIPFARYLQTLFPVEEQVLFADVLALLEQQEAGKERGHHLIAVGDGSGEFVGMAWVEVKRVAGLEPRRRAPAGIFWYMGLDPSRQKQGLGSRLYQILCGRMFDEEGCGLIVMEVERVDVATRLHGEDAGRTAARRLRFYMQRHKALRLEGVDYTQETGWQPGVPMHVLIQPRPTAPPPDAETAFRIARALLGSGLRRKRGEAVALVSG